MKSAPTIILCPSYESSRGEIITMASALQDQQYNVFVFDFSARVARMEGARRWDCRKSPGNACGPECGSQSWGCGRQPVRLVGRGHGSDVALAEATGDPRVRASAVESRTVARRKWWRCSFAARVWGRFRSSPGLSQMIFGWMNIHAKNVPSVDHRESPSCLALRSCIWSRRKSHSSRRRLPNLFRISSPPLELVGAAARKLCGDAGR